MHFRTILVINCGSSSVKFTLYSAQNDEAAPVATGLASRLDQEKVCISITTLTQSKSEYLVELKGAHSTPHEQTIEFILSKLEDSFDLSSTLAGVGHRVVHGGHIFKQSVVIDNQVMSQIESCIPLAPLHNPANISGIKCLALRFPDIDQIAVFDTAFHQTIPERAFTYALPKDLCSELLIRRYGFHGTSYRYITQEASTYFSKSMSEINLIVAHLGNGASVTAIADGKSVDTSMGMTPVEGLVMGTRCGDLDPGIFNYLISRGYSPSAIDTMINKNSGLLGISGSSNDMRALCSLSENGDLSAGLAIDVFCFKVAKYIAAMLISLSQIDGLVFTGGIGENAPLVRKKIVDQLKLLQFEIDESLNNDLGHTSVTDPTVGTKESIKILVIPTNEELMIVRDTLELI